MTHPSSLRHLSGNACLAVALALWALVEVWSLARARRRLRGLHHAAR